MPYQDGQQYGDILIQGNASVQLGDRTIDRLEEYHIETAYVVLQNEIEGFQADPAGPLRQHLQRVLEHQDSWTRPFNKRCSAGPPSLRKQNTGNRYRRGERKLPGAAYSDNTTAKRMKCDKKDPNNSDASNESSAREASSSGRHRCVPSRISVHRVMSDVRTIFCPPIPRQTREYHTRTLSATYHRIQPALTKPIIIGKIVNMFSGQQEYQFEQLSFQLRDVALYALILQTPLQQLASICAFMMMCSLYKLSLAKRHTKLIERCQGDQIWSVMAWLFSIGMERYIQCSSSIRKPLLGDSIILEDVFGHDRRIPLLLCDNVRLVETFFKNYYRGTPVQDLVDRGEYGISLATQKGFTIRDGHWVKKNLIRPDMRFMTRIIMRMSDSRCPKCEIDLAVVDFTELHCASCERSFHRYPAIRPLSVSLIGPQSLPTVQLDTSIEQLRKPVEAFGSADRQRGRVVKVVKVLPIDLIKNVALQIESPQAPELKPRMQSDIRPLSHENSRGPFATENRSLVGLRTLTQVVNERPIRSRNAVAPRKLTPKPTSPTMDLHTSHPAQSHIHYTSPPLPALWATDPAQLFHQDSTQSLLQSYLSAQRAVEMLLESIGTLSTVRPVPVQEPVI